MARKRNKYHYIYKTTNLLNDKYYIGMHSTSNLDDGYMGSGKRLRYSINKHGVTNHKIEILEFFDSREELVKREEEVVNLDEIAKVECMNLRVGGSGGFSPEQQRLNAEKSNAKQRVLRETDPEWVGAYNNKISAARVKEYADGERSKKWQKDWTGLKHSEEAKRKMSESTKGTGTGKDNSQYGTYWISKDGVSKKIKKEDLESMTQQGWVRGIKK